MSENGEKLKSDRSEEAVLTRLLDQRDSQEGKNCPVSLLSEETQSLDAKERRNKATKRRNEEFSESEKRRELSSSGLRPGVPALPAIDGALAE